MVGGGIEYLPSPTDQTALRGRVTYNPFKNLVNGVKEFTITCNGATDLVFKGMKMGVIFDPKS